MCNIPMYVIIKLYPPMYEHTAPAPEHPPRAQESLLGFQQSKHF